MWCHLVSHCSSECPVTCRLPFVFAFTLHTRISAMQGVGGQFSFIPSDRPQKAIKWGQLCRFSPLVIFRVQVCCGCTIRMNTPLFWSVHVCTSSVEGFLGLLEDANGSQRAHNGLKVCAWASEVVWEQLEKKSFLRHVGPPVGHILARDTGAATPPTPPPLPRPDTHTGRVAPME